MARKGQYEIVYRTLFGKLSLPSPRYYPCRCQDQSGLTVSPLVQRLPQRTSPDLLYLQAKFAALMSYGLTMDLLDDIFPLAGSISLTGLKRQVQRVGATTRRLNSPLSPRNGPLS